MSSQSPTSQDSTTELTIAHCAPLAVFVLLLSVQDLIPAVSVEDSPDAPWYWSHPRHWLYPLQTIVGIACLMYWWRHYVFRPHRGWLLATGAGVLGILVWLLPGHLYTTFHFAEGWWSYLGITSRADGFNPGALSERGSSVYCLTVVARFVRMVLVVPLVEELFWRGFLMRFLADPEGDFWNVPFGTHHQRSLVGVTLMFVLIHNSSDYVGAAIFGLLMYGVCVRTRSLSACVLMHAVANLCLGIYVMLTEQWGYW